jgi:hypothetical protein
MGTHYMENIFAGCTNLKNIELSGDNIFETYEEWADFKEVPWNVKISFNTNDLPKGGVFTCTKKIYNSLDKPENPISILRDLRNKNWTIKQI